MPVLIVTSDPTDGEITETDLKKMKVDFINEAEVKPYNGRIKLIKKFSVAVMKSEIKNLVKFYENINDIDIINMNFAITLNPFEACNGDSSDSMTVVVEAATFIDKSHPELGFTSHVSAGDYVVIPGYKNANMNNKNVENGMKQMSTLTTDPPCCPSSYP